MRFDWQLQPLQRKLAWDLDAARARLAEALSSQAQTQERVRQLQRAHAAQAVALAVSQRWTDPAVHADGVAWFQASEDQMASMRAACLQAERDVEAARTACRLCSQHVEVLAAVHDAAYARFQLAQQRQDSKDADFAWLAGLARERW